MADAPNPDAPAKRPSSPSRVEPPPEPPADDPKAMSALRRLLFGDAAKRIERLEARSVEVDDVAQVLPQAIESREQPDHELGRALTSTIEEGLKDSVRKDPKTIADAIFPVLGPAIRNYISDALRRFVQSTNTVIEQSLSPRSVGWRVQALLTGKPFAEIVLSNTLFYRVEQVFLVYRESGICLEQVEAATVQSWDGDLASGMLTALGDFARDSFAVEEGDMLGAFTFGGLEVRVVQGPKAILAAAVRGNPPTSLDEQLEQAIEGIHLDAADALATFDGDTTPFREVRPRLEACLLEKRRTKEKKRRLPWPAIGFFVLAAALLTWWLVARGSARSAEDRLIATLRDTPGIVVTRADREGGRVVVEGLRDPISVDPGTLVAASDVDAERVTFRWRPDYSAEDAIVARRATALFDTPATVTLAMSGGVLRGTGRCGPLFAARLRDRGATVPGVTSVDVSGLTVIDPDAELRGRVVAAVTPPSGVELGVIDGVVTLRGVVSRAWLDRARRAIVAIEGVASLDVTGVVASSETMPLAQRLAVLLDAPATASLTVDDGGRVTIRGAATTAWAIRARNTVLATPGVIAYDDRGLVRSDAAEVVLARARLALKPPQSVRLRIDGTTLVATGRAPHAWLDVARRFTANLDGLDRFATDGLVDTDAEAFDRVRTRIRRARLRFRVNRATLETGQSTVLYALAADTRTLLAASRALSQASRIRVRGSTHLVDGRVIGDLGDRRARAAIDLLVAEGLPRDAFVALPAKHAGDEEDDRVVSFAIDETPR